MKESVLIGLLKIADLQLPAVFILLKSAGKEGNKNVTTRSDSHGAAGFLYSHTFWQKLLGFSPHYCRVWSLPYNIQ